MDRVGRTSCAKDRGGSATCAADSQPLGLHLVGRGTDLNDFSSSFEVSGAPTHSTCLAAEANLCSRHAAPKVPCQQNFELDASEESVSCTQLRVNFGTCRVAYRRHRVHGFACSLPQHKLPHAMDEGHKRACVQARRLSFQLRG